MTQPLAWSHRTSEIADADLEVERAASAAERAAIVQALDVIACEDAKAEYVIRPLGGGGYRMSGTVSARLTQRCVVTLEGVLARIEERFEVEFWPPDDMPPAPEGELEVLGGPDIEPLDHAEIAAGRIVFETLSASLDPYPRKEGARFDWQEADASDAGAAGPFAGLKKLKKDR